ncbi:hypothetical protein, partial, partial [Absidia glauca]
MAKWDSNSCFIDCIIEVIQRIVLKETDVAAPKIGSQMDTSLLDLLIEIQQNVRCGDYVKGTKLARNYFWANGMKKGAQNDCQVIFHQLTDDSPLTTIFSCTKEDGKQVKAFEMIRQGESSSLQELFAAQKYIKPSAINLPEFITLNDLVTAQVTNLQYDYPNTFTAFGYKYDLCARVMAASQAGGHFNALIKDKGISYKADNMNERLQVINDEKLYGKAKNTIYVLYKKTASPASPPASPPF